MSTGVRPSASSASVRAADRRSAPGRGCRAGSPSRAGPRRRRARSAPAQPGRRHARASPRRRPPAPSPGAGSRAGSRRRRTGTGRRSRRGRRSPRRSARAAARPALGAIDFRWERCSGAPARRATSISSPTASSTPRALVADVRDERRAERGGLLGDRDELVGAGVRAGDVDEAEREHPRARLQAEADLAAHRAKLVGGRLHVAVAEHEVAHRAVADRRHERRAPGAPRRARRGTRRTSSTSTPPGLRPRAHGGRRVARRGDRARPAPARGRRGRSPRW